jgi:hypothetical protein
VNWQGFLLPSMLLILTRLAIVILILIELVPKVVIIRRLYLKLACFEYSIAIRLETDSSRIKYNLTR